MSDKVKNSEWSFSRVITAGDVILFLSLVATALGILVEGVRLQDKVDNHEVRITKAEDRIERDAIAITQQGTAIAVITSHQDDPNHGVSHLRTIKGDQ